MNEPYPAQPFPGQFSQPSVPAAYAVTAPTYSLFSAPAIAIATFFGTPAAGAWLMSVNFRRLGDKGNAALTLVVGIVATGLAILIGYLTPRGVSLPVGIALLVGMRQAAVAMQGEAVTEHVSRGGKLGSKWVAFGVGMGFLAVLFAVVFLVIYIPTYMHKGQRHKMIIGTNDEVYYTGSATEQDARALGAALRRNEYFTDKGTSVFVDKGSDGTTISLVQHEGVWDRPGMLASAEEVVREVAPAVGGFPVRVHLINSAEEVKKQGLVGREPIGKDEIFYYDSATESETQALGRALQGDKYFQGRGTSVLLRKDEAGTVVSFVVADGFWNDPTHVMGFETIVRDVAPTVGGLPITLHLVNTTLEVKKEVLVN